MNKFNKNEDFSIMYNYFKDINSLKIELLTPEEEVVLAKRIQEGDDEALALLVKANLKFVVAIANDYKGKGIPLSDLVSEGNYGLMKAAMKFDHTRGFRFITYGVWWVKQAILQCLNEHARTIRLPVNILNKVYQLQRELNDSKVVGSEINDEDEVDGVSYIDSLPKCQSLNFVVSETGDEIYELIASETFKPYDELKNEDVDIKTQITECLNILDERERDIIIKYYGLFEEDVQTLEVIGDEYELTKERVRQIKSKAIKKLQKNLISIIKIK